MKEPRMHTDESVPQSVTDFIKIPSHQESIQIGFTDQRVSPHAGLAPFIGFLHWHQLTKVLEKLLPHAPTSNHANNPTDTALGFVMGILSGA